MSAQTSASSPAAKPDPDLRASFDLFEEHYFLNGEWRRLADLYRDRIASPSLADDATERTRLWLRLARIQEEKLADEEAAIASYRECVGLAPGRRPALERLRGLYKRRRSWTTVLQIAELEVECLRDPIERARLLREMGDIWEQELGDSEQAEVLHASARALEGESASEPAPSDAGAPAVVARARARMKAGDLESALALLRERLAAEPRDLEALDLLFHGLETAGRHAELPAVLEQRVAQASDGATRAELLVQLAGVHENALDDVDAARRAYERAMGSDPGNETAGLALERLYRARRDPASLRTLLETRLAVAPPGQQAALRARLHELVDASPESSPRSEDADDALAERLAELEGQGAGTSPPAVRLRLRLAERAESGGDAAHAVKLLTPCLEDERALRQVARVLRRIHQQRGDHRALVALAERAAMLCREPAERADWYRSAAAAARAAGDGERTARCLERLLEETPGDAEAEDSLIELRRSRGEARPLLALLRQALHRARPGDQARLHSEAAALLEEQLGDPDAAFVHWRRAVALQPGDDERVERALACAGATGGALRQLDLLELAAAAASRPRDRARLLARRGELMADALRWTDEGIESWRQSLALDPDQPALQARLDACGAGATAAG